jgi:tetratricopeptide (TPR) repeat protein
VIVVVASVLALFVQQSEVRLRAGQEKVKVRDFDGAIPDFEKCLELNPEQYNAHFGLGTCFWEKDEYKKASGHFAKVVELVEKTTPGAPLPTVHQKLLGCALLLEEFDAAIAEATKLIAIQATAEYYFARALARQRSGDAKGAIEDCDAALKEDNLLTKARTLKAEGLMAGGEGKSAMAELDEAVRLKPSDPAAFLARACAHYREGRWKEAQQDLQSASALSTGLNSNLETQGYAIALDQLVRIRLQAPGSAGASAFEKTLKSLKKDPSGNHLFALPLYVAGQLPEAGLMAAAEAVPGRKAQARAEALFFIGERKLLAKDLEGAKEAFRNCVETGARGLTEHNLARIRLQELFKIR